MILHLYIRKIATALLLLGAATACSANESPLSEVPINTTQAEAQSPLPSGEPSTSTENTPPSHHQLITEPIRLAEGKVDLDGDGRNETAVYLQITSGEKVTDPEPGPYQGTFYSGQFEWSVVQEDGTEVHKLNVNEVGFHNEVMILSGQPFELLFEDYNGDENPDFNIGQRLGSNGSTYAIFSISPAQGLQLLQRDIYSADSRPSIRYRKVGDRSYLNRYYDMDKGIYMDIRYEWKDGKFVPAADPSPAQEPGSAGLD